MPTQRDFDNHRHLAYTVEHREPDWPGYPSHTYSAFTRWGARRMAARAKANETADHPVFVRIEPKAKRA